jgi:integrase
MARDFKMTWIPDRRSWTAKYRGRKYTVSIKQLKEEGYSIQHETKEGSYIAANGWWKIKRLKIDNEEREARAAQVGTPTPRQQAGMAFVAPGPVDQEWWEGEVYIHGGVEKTRQMYEEIYQMFLDRIMAGGSIPQDMQVHLGPAKTEELAQAARVLRLEEVSKDKSVGGVRDSYLKAQLANHRAGQLSARKYNEKMTLVGHLVDFLGASSDVSAIDGSRWAAYKQHVLSKLKPAGPWGPNRAQDAVTVARELIRWTYEQGLLAELPRNLHGRFKIKDRTGDRSKKKTAVTWTPQEFKDVLAQATGRMRLFLLLMANCGFTQIDISELKDFEVNWEAGKITRRRSKTRHQDQTPEVCYPLWPSTLSLLQQHRSGGPVVLVTDRGTPYVQARVDAEARTKVKDGIKGHFIYFRRKIGFTKPLKGLRKMGPTLLAPHAEFGRYAEHFLGHAPKNMADTHYITPSQERFDAAVLWLGQQLGQVEG